MKRAFIVMAVLFLFTQCKNEWSPEMEKRFLANCIASNERADVSEYCACLLANVKEDGIENINAFTKLKQEALEALHNECD